MLSIYTTIYMYTIYYLKTHDHKKIYFYFMRLSQLSSFIIIVIITKCLTVKPNMEMCMELFIYKKD